MEDSRVDSNKGVITKQGSSSLGHFPGRRWEFDDAVSAVFEDMLARSIPQIESMREVVFQTARRLIQPRTDVVDLGCARGDAMARLLTEEAQENSFVGVEVSKAMLTVCRERFQMMINEGKLQIRDNDLRTDYPPVRASVTLCVLTLQFIPIEYRARVLADVIAHTVPGGALILVEKILGGTAVMDRLLVDLYYRHKRAMGYTQDEIEAKRMSLEGALVPLTAEWNEQLLRSSGFRHVECIWRCMNFCGWVALA
jgi:tRNA (cmo5U34)-methyltransferase